MLSRITILIYIFSTGLLLAQSPGSSSNSSARKEPQSSQGSELVTPPANSNHTNGVYQNLSSLEKSITEKISRLEKLQAKVAEINKNLKEKVSIPDEAPNITKDNGVLIVSARHIEFSFKEEKTKEVKIVSSKKRLSNDLHSVVRTLTFAPGDFASIKIKVDQFDSKMKGVDMIENYNNMAPEVKLVALKAIDLVITNTIFRMDSYLQKGETDKQENTKTHLTEL